MDFLLGDPNDHTVQLYSITGLVGAPVKLVPSVHNAVKSGFKKKLYFMFCLSWTHNGRVRIHFSAWVHI